MVATAVSSSAWGSPGSAAAPAVSRDGDRVVVWLSGEHDIATVFVLADTLARAIAVGGGDVVVDLSQVGFIGAATIDLLVRSKDLLGQQSRTLTVRSPSRRAIRLLDLCGLLGLVETSRGIAGPQPDTHG